MSQKPYTPQLRRAIILIIIAMFVIMGSLPMILAQATTPTPSATTPKATTPASSGLKIQIDKGNGVDNTQETGFNFLVKNTGSSMISNISTRIYFTTDGSNAASGYVLEKYYDQSNGATISGPTLLSGSTYYFTVSFGTTALLGSAQWEFQTALHLSSWASTFSGANDYYHTGYAVGAFPAAYTDTNYIPAYVSGTLVWGTVPGGPTPTFIPPTTAVPTTAVPTTAVPTTQGAALPDLVLVGFSYLPSNPPCANLPAQYGITIKNNGNADAGAFVVAINSTTQTVSGLAAGASITLKIPLQSGMVTATADSTNVITESNETNNSATTNLAPVTGTPSPTCTPAQLADLVVSSVTAQPNVCNNTVALQIVIANNGNVAAGSMIVQAVQQNNSANVQTDSLTGGLNGSVAAGGTITISMTLALASPPVTYVVTADSTNAVAESNENNNTGSTTITVLPAMPCPTGGTPTFTPTGPLPDLVVTQIMFVGSANPCVSAPYDQVTIANNGTADATGSFQVKFAGLTQTVNGLAAGQSLALKFATVANNGTVATVDSTNVIAESNENNNTMTATTLPALTPTLSGKTCATITPTITLTPTKSNTPNPNDPCTNPTVITDGGSLTISTTTTCFKYVNTTFKYGGMFSMMNGSSTTASNTLKWYGGLDQNVTACTNQSSTVTSNGGQLNNFTVAKDSTGAMYLTVTGNISNTISLSIQNWQNGSGCSVAPTPIGAGGPTTTATSATVTKTPSPTPSPTIIMGT